MFCNELSYAGGNRECSVSKIEFKTQKVNYSLMSSAQLETLQNAIIQQELDLNDMEELLKEDPDNEELKQMKEDAEKTLKQMKEQLDQIRLTVTTPTPTIKNNSQEKPKEDEPPKPTFRERDNVIAFSTRDNGWFAARITKKVGDRYWVRFGPRDNQQVTVDQIRSVSETSKLDFATVEKRRIRPAPSSMKHVTELPKWTKPAPNDTEKDLLMKKKKRHQLKSIMKFVQIRKEQEMMTRRQQKEEEDLRQKKNSWMEFSSKIKK